MSDYISAWVYGLFSSCFQGCPVATVPRKIIEERYNFLLITVLSTNVMRKSKFTGIS